MSKNVQCPSCSSVLAKSENGKLVFDNMKAVSIIEFPLVDEVMSVKCHSCHNWSSIDKQHNIQINYKRKSQDAIYNAENVTFKRSGNIYGKK